MVPIQRLELTTKAELYRKAWDGNCTEQWITLSSYWSLHPITLLLYHLTLSVYHSKQKSFHPSLLFLSYMDGQTLNPSLISASQPVSTPWQNLSSGDWNANFQIVSSEGLCKQLRKIHTNVAPHPYHCFVYILRQSHTHSRHASC